MNAPLRNYNLDELQAMGLISVRAWHVCDAHGLVDLELIHEHYLNNKTFKQLRQIGISTNVELIRLCSKYDTQIVSEGNETGKQSLEIYSVLQPLSQHQLKMLDQYVNTCVKALNQRARNVMANFVGVQPNFLSVYSTLMEEKTAELPPVRNMGLKTKLEIQAMLQNLYKKYEQVQGLSDEVVNLQTLTYWLHEHFKLEEAAFAPFLTPLQQGSFPLFGFINYLLMQEKLMDKRETLIFVLRTGYFPGKQIESMDKLAVHFKISRERIRQIAENLTWKFDKQVAKLAERMDLASIVQRYDWNLGGDLLYTTSDHAERLNNAESINFNPSFYTYILSIILADTYQLLPDTHQHDYLLHVQLFESFNFEEMLADIAKRLYKKNDRAYLLNFETYLASFLTNKDGDLLPRIAEVCRGILELEFEGKIPFNADGNIDFPRNTPVNVGELAEELLDAESRPLPLAIIHERLKSNPDYHLEKMDQLRHLLKGNKAIFIYFGRTSTYGLRKWEGSIEGIKGGTIRSIVEEYLEMFDEPRHIAHILEHVRQFRPTTNRNSIQHNLKLTKANIFLNFFGNFWGLTKKNYAPPEEWVFKPLPNTVNGIKRGTIQSIVVEFLEKLGEPKHIRVIAEHVLQLRPTTSRHNIHSNLRRSQSNQFLHFPGGFWGLTSKQYTPEQLIFQPFPKTIKGSINQSIIEAYLDRFDEPRHIKAIAEHVRQFRPATNRDHLQSNLKKLKSNKFINFHAGFWGLVSKNYAPEHLILKPLPNTVKEGSIQGIVEEYLEKFDEPRSTASIVAHVRQFKPTTNRRSVHTRLRRSQINKFLYFPGGFWGLASKNYEPKQWVFKPLPNTFKGNTIRSIVEEYLDKFDEPKHITPIAEHVLQFRPTTNLENIKSNLKQVERSQFLRFPGEFWGLASKHYEPKQWVFKPLPNTFKGGTIRNIVEEYLDKFEEPKHIKAIAEHVLQFRPTTNWENIQSNLKQIRSQFQRFPGGFWGLTSKNYAPENLIFKRVPPFVPAQITKLLKDKGELPLEQLMELLVEKLKVREVQLDTSLESMVQKGKLCISDDGMVSLPTAHQQIK